MKRYAGPFILMTDCFQPLHSCCIYILLQMREENNLCELTKKASSKCTREINILITHSSITDVFAHRKNVGDLSQVFLIFSKRSGTGIESFQKKSILSLFVLYISYSPRKSVERITEGTTLTLFFSRRLLCFQLLRQGLKTRASMIP